MRQKSSAARSPSHSPSYSLSKTSNNNARKRRSVSRATIIKGRLGCSQKASGRGWLERYGRWRRTRKEGGGGGVKKERASERASQIETNGDLYASRRVPQFYCRLISSPASDSVLLLLLRRYGLSPLLSLLLRLPYSAPRRKRARNIGVDRTPRRSVSL